MRARKPASLLCKRGHCFDISRLGYVNFLPQQRQTLYTKALFEDRRAVLEADYYAPLVKALRGLIAGHAQGNFTLLDAGCGEGFYARELRAAFPDATLFAFDNAKEGVALAAKRDGGVRWFVGDITNIPLRDGATDWVLDVFSPSNYGEFGRVLRPGGYLLKVIPGELYLRELRGLRGEESEKAAYSTRPVVEYLQKHMALVEECALLYTRPVPPEMAQAFARMSPILFGVPVAAEEAARITELTFAFTLLLAQSPAR